jgi:protoporphyrinogen oxidase
MRDLVSALEEPVPEEVRRAANRLRYRDFLIVSLIINRKEVVPDNWIYVHDPSVKVGRSQNFKNWSPAMVPDPNKTCLGMEYFVFQDDDLWSSRDDKLIDLARREIAQLGLVRPEEIEDGTVVRMPKAYPIYHEDYVEQVNVIRRYVEQNLTNLQLVGRNGMHKYNNQDHSMMTALGAARNILGAHDDLWAINTEPEYQEEKRVANRGDLPRPAYAEPRRVGAHKPTQSIVADKN